MSKVEEMLSGKKIEINELQVPDELEARLNNALQSRMPVRRKRNRWAIAVASLLIAFILVTYNADTLAFYGRELLGFDNIMNGTLRDLNKLGMGQTIEKSYTLSNGVKVTLNGVMIDDNQLIAFYTLESPSGNVEDINLGMFYMSGAYSSNYQTSGQGEVSEDKKTIRWVGEFDPPRALEKKLTWQFEISNGGKSEKGEISFVLDRDKAMGHTLKSKLNKKIKVDNTNIKFDTIQASPTTTIINGTIQNIIQLAIDQLSGERIYSPSLDIKLLADGKEVAHQGMEVGTDNKGIKFETRYDALPRDLKKLQLRVVRFGAEHEINEQISLDNSDAGHKIQVQGKDITIDKLEEKNGETYIIITTEDSVVLSRVYLLADNNKAELLETIEGQRDKKPDGTITHTRTLRFKATGKDLKLDIKRIRYEQACDQYIDIPID